MVAVGLSLVLVKFQVGPSLSTCTVIACLDHELESFALVEGTDLDRH